MNSRKVACGERSRGGEVAHRTAVTTSFWSRSQFISTWSGGKDFLRLAAGMAGGTSSILSLQVGRG